MRYDIFRVADTVGINQHHGSELRSVQQSSGMFTRRTGEFIPCSIEIRQPHRWLIAGFTTLVCRLFDRPVYCTRREGFMNIYVGNLPHEVTDEELREAFEAFGEVTSVNIIKDKYSGQPRGFGFVEMPTNGEGQAAISGLNGKEMKERTLAVSEARPRSEGDRGGGRHS